MGLRARKGKLPPPGGLQPKDAGIKKTAKALGVTREDVLRAKAIAGIPPKVKAAAIAAELHNNQRALLQIARAPTPSAQFKVIEEMIERRRAERESQTTAAKAKAAREIAALEADLAKDKRTRATLKAKVASTHQRLRDLKDAPPEDEGDFVASPPTAPSSDQDVLADVLAAAPPLDVEKLVERQADAVARLQARIRQLEDELARAPKTAPLPEAASPPFAGDQDIPALSDQPDALAAFDDIRAAWNAAAQVRTVYSNAPKAAQVRFAVECLGCKIARNLDPTSKVSQGIDLVGKD